MMRKYFNYHIFYKILLPLILLAPGVAIASPLEQLLTSEHLFQGVESDSKAFWPFNIKITNYNQESGTFEGQINWPGLKTTAKLKGKHASDSIEFTTTEYVGRNRRALLGCVYKLNTLSGGWIKGSWDAPPSHNGKYTKREIQIYLNPNDNQLKVGTLTLSTRFNDIESLDLKASGAYHIHRDSISSIVVQSDKYRVSLYKIGDIGSGPQRYLNDFKQVYTSFRYANNKDYVESKTWQKFNLDLKYLTKPDIAYRIPCNSELVGICDKLKIDNGNVVFESGYIWLLGSGLILEASAIYNNGDPSNITPENISKAIQGRNSAIEEKALVDRGLIVGKVLTTEAHQLAIKATNNQIHLNLSHRGLLNPRDRSLPSALEESDWDFVHKQLNPYLSIWNSKFPSISEQELLGSTSTSSAAGF